MRESFWYEYFKFKFELDIKVEMYLMFNMGLFFLVINI